MIFLKKTAVITALFFSLLSIVNADEQNINRYRVHSCWDKAKDIMLHVPGSESFWINVFPIASGYTDLFDQKNVENEFKQIINILKKNGVNVKDTKDVILSDSIDLQGNRLNNSQLYQLQDFSSNFFKVKIKGITTPLSFDIDSYKTTILKSMAPQTLYKLIFLNPTIELKQEVDYKTANNVLSPTFITDPLVNFFYINASAVTTDKGLVICRLANPQRWNETGIMKFIYSRLMIQPILEIKGGATFEGGDYIPTAKFNLIGKGLRTNSEGVSQLLRNNVFSAHKQIVVKDSLQIPEQMHLRSYFNIVSDKLALISKDRMSGNKRPKADVYTYNPQTEKYTLTEQDIDFINLLEKEFSFDILPIGSDDVANYAIDFFLIEKNHIITSADCSREFKEMLRKEGVKADYVSIPSIQSGGGGVGSVIQVLKRSFDSKSTDNYTVPEIGNI